MNSLVSFINAYGTRLLAVLQGTVVTLTATGIIPDGQMKYWIAATAVLTYWRGQSVSNTVSNLTAQVQSQAPQKDKP